VGRCEVWGASLLREVILLLRCVLDEPLGFEISTNMMDAGVCCV
jgi:hypothetical protein